MAKILIAGLNPAWQQILTMDSLHVGEVNRAAQSHTLAGGKGLNAAKILARQGHDVSVLQVLAGANGDRLLDACTAWGILSLHVFSEGETRAAITLIHDATATEIIEPFAIGGEDLEENLLEAVPQDTEYDFLLVCGTLPAGLDPAFYQRLVSKVRCKQIIWDSVAAFDAETAKRITWLKVNAAEHREIAPRLKSFGATPSLLITDGPGKTLVANADGMGTYVLPVLERVVSPIGAGDTVTAMLTHGLATRETSAEAAIKHALACSMASCLSPLPAEWKPWDASHLEKSIVREA